MPENEFERRMQESMEELKIRPSESVWPKVEAELKTKRKRRVVFFILLLAGLGLIGYSGYTFMKTGHTESLAQRDNSSSKTPATANSQDHPASGIVDNSVTNNDNNKVTTEPSINSQATSNIDIKSNDKTPQTTTRKSELTAPSPSTQKTGNTIINQNLPVEDQTNVTIQQKKNRKKIIVQPAQPVITKTTSRQARGNELVHKNNNRPNNNVPVNTPSAVATDNKPVTNERVEEVVEQPRRQIPDSAVAKATVPAVNNESLVKDSSQKQDIAAIKKNKKQSRVRFGLDLSAGMSFRGDRILSMKNTRSYQDISFNSPAAGNGGAAGAPTQQPSSIKTGPAFKIGAVAQLPLSERSSFVTGLRYSYLSEEIKIGDYYSYTVPLNSYTYGLSQFNIRGVYGGVQQTEHTNKYHFLELPLNYELRLSKEKKPPVVLNAGITPAYLIASNALVYDSSFGGVYYKNKEVFNKFHLNLQAGLSLGIGKNKSQWSVGPQISLDTKSLVKNNSIGKKQYFVFAGITGRMLFNKPKK